MEAEDFDEAAFFVALATRGVRYLLIGRRAIAALGAPVLTSDYDLWIELDDTERLNAVAHDFELYPTHSPEESRQRGHYVLEGPEHIDVMVARTKHRGRHRARVRRRLREGCRWKLTERSSRCRASTISS